jgi:phospholipid transport system substrate-binding protein
MIRRRFLSSVLVLALAAGLAHPALAATADFKSTAQAFVSVKGNEAIQAFGIPDRAQRYERFKGLLDESFAMDAIARFAAGRYWKQATDEQKTRYLKQFQTYMLANYAAKAWNVKGVALNIRKVDLIENGDALVDTDIFIPHKEKQNVTLGFLVRDTSQGAKIIDLQVDGISLIMTHRDEFTAKMNQMGGNFDKFCDFLAERTRNLENDADMAAQFEAGRKSK